MKKTVLKIYLPLLALAVLLVSVPQAFAKDNYNKSNYSSRNNYRYSSSLYNRNRNDWNRNYSYRYYQRYLPHASRYRHYMFVDRDHPNRMIRIFNRAYRGNDRNSIIIIRVSDSTFRMLERSVPYYYFSRDFRFDRDSRDLVFRSPNGMIYTRDLDVN